MTTATTTTPSPMHLAIKALARGERLGEDLTAAAFGQLMGGEASPVQAAALLIGLRVQGETDEEVAGAVRAMRGAMVRVEIADRRFLIDTCGTGGGTVSTFNISTAAAFVAAGAGVRVAKHGNRSFTSQCGSADVLEALRGNIESDASQAVNLLKSSGVAFLFAPSFHPAMRFVGPVRRELAVPTIMNIVGPLSNPASVGRQVLGVADPARAPVLAGALQRLGAEHAVVVHGTAGMDEISPRGTTLVWEVKNGTVSTWELEPGRYGLEVVNLAALAGGDPQANAERIRSLFERPMDDVAGRAAVVLNAGAAIYVSGKADSIEDGIEQASASLNTGAAAERLQRFVQGGTP